MPEPSGDNGPEIFVRAVDGIRRRPSADGPPVSIDAEGPEGLLVADLVHAPGDPGGVVLLLDPEDAEAAVEVIDVPGQPGRLVDLDVTSLENPEAFEMAIKNSASGEGPVLLRLSGRLAARILLPGFGGPELPPDTVLLADELAYAQAVPDASDRSTRAEFLRAMALTRGDERERHQTTALGLEALTASSTGA